MKKIDLRHCATERLSGFVFYVLIGLIVVLGLLFRLIGYDMPYEYNFDYNAPLLTGAVVTFMLLLTGGTLLLMVCTMIRGMRLNSDENRVVNNIPARRISVCVALGTLLLLVLTFALSSTDALKVNGAATIAVRLLCRTDNGGCAGGYCRSCRCRRGRSTHRIACAAEDEGLCHAAGSCSCAGADTAGDEP